MPANELMKHHCANDNKRLAYRLARFYGTVFLLIGIIVPYSPSWLEGRHLDAVEISFILAAPLLMRVFFTPLIAFFADHIGDRRHVLILLAWGSFLSLLAFIPAKGFWPHLLISMVFGIFWTSVMPLTESIAMTRVRLQGLDYGRIRLWGSLTFIAASLIGGLVIDHWGEASVLVLMLIAILLTIASAYGLPDDGNKAPLEKATPLPPIHWRDAVKLIQSKLFILFLLTSAGIQSTHAIYYGFGTLHWQSLHMTAGVIGTLWAIGVIAEVSLFAWSNTVVERFGPTRLLIIGASGAVLRWTLTAFDPPLALLFPVQTLHAASFGAAHLGAIHFIARAVPEQYSATGQGLYAAFAMGIIMGLMTMLSGSLYAAFDGKAYLLMALVGGLSLVGALLLNHIWQGEQLIGKKPTDDS